MMQTYSLFDLYPRNPLYVTLRRTKYSKLMRTAGSIFLRTAHNMGILVWYGYIIGKHYVCKL